MVAPFIASALRGLLGTSTASFYRLNRFGIPVSLIIDINPLPNENKTSLDMIDAESSTDELKVTRNPLQDFTSATSNAHKLPIRISITGTISSDINLGLLGSFGVGNIPGIGSPFRKDLQVLETLRAMQDRKEPIMVVTPRRSLAKAWITLINDNWEVSLGRNTMVAINVEEARIISPLDIVAVVPDVASSNTGNNAVSAAGGQSGTSIATQTVTAPPAPGAAPGVVGLSPA